MEKVYSKNSEASEYRAIHRNDNGKRLNIVSSAYKPGTNERFMEIVNKLHEMTGFKIVGYSEFNEGRKVLAYLQNQEPVKIGDFDQTNYMVCGNSFDYSMAWFNGLTTKVHRCANEFGMIRADQRFRHDGNLNKKLDRLVEFYQGFVNQERALKQKFETWCGIQIPEELKELFVDHVLDIKPEVKAADELSTIKKKQRASLFASVNEEIAAMGNNVYGLFNGLTHYTTHKATAKEKVVGNVLGHPANLNKKGYQLLDSWVVEHA